MKMRTQSPTACCFWAAAATAVFGLLACEDSGSSDTSPPQTGQAGETPQKTVQVADSAVVTGEQSALPSDLDYEVIGEDTFQDDRRSLDVRLSRKVDEAVLETLAYRLRDRAKGTFERTFITYYLPGMQVDAGAWATSHFDPNLEIRILGVGDEGASRVQKIRNTYGQDLIGIWENNQPGSASTFALFRTDSGFGLKQVYPDGSARTYSLREESAQRGRRFRDPENTFGEYWLLRQGNLELHDPEGMVFTARPVSGGGS